MRILRPIRLLLPLLACAAHASPQLALGNGESLDYHVSWAILPGVGEISINAKAVTDVTGARLLEVDSKTSTRGLAHLILPFDATAESLFDPASGRLVWLGESSNARGRSSAHTVAFDYAKGVANYTNGSQPGAARALPMPEGYPTDLITCLLEARNWGLQPGDTRDALVLFEQDFYLLTIHAVKYELVTTPLGTFRSLLLEPRMEKTPPKGMFRKGSTVRVWIAGDPPHLPVRFEVNFSFGAGTATLWKYRPPSTPAAPPRASR